MYYIHKYIRIRKREVMILHVLPTFIVFVAFIFVTFITWNIARNNQRTEQTRQLNQYNQEVISSINQQMKAYEDVLFGVRSLFRVNTAVTKQDWDRITSAYDLSTRYKGIQAIGYVQQVASDQVPGFLSVLPSRGVESFSLFPPSTSGIVAPVVFISPYDGVNSRAIGYDMYSDTTRREAMERARDSGEATLSDPVTLIQDQDQTPARQSFLLYYPIYRNDELPASIEERQSAIVGFVYAAFRTSDFLSESAARNNDYNFVLSSRSNDSYAPFFSSFSSEDQLQYETSLSRIIEFDLFGAKWRILGNITGTRANLSYNNPSYIVLAGVVLSTLLAGFIYLLLVNRTRALADKEEETVQEAKDELLALASHQLRTPATGVKQYIGMVRDGFAGPITAMQKKLLDKAYESNERQLGTINEMLFVARTDAGQLKMELTTLNISQLLRDITEDHRETFKARKQKLSVHIPKRDLFIKGDRQYLRMAVENIISNASKYTDDKGTVTLRLKNTADSVIITAADTGVGVSEQDIPLLFKKFSRIPNERTNMVSGSGIGLYLAKKVSDAHNGTISFVSKEGEGSTVTIKLPKEA